MAITQRLTLAQFLALPDEEPALELEPDGVVVQKVSPKGRHSRLQLVLCERINQFAEPHRAAMAFPELRVVFGGAAYVPDVSVFGWELIPRTADGEIADMRGEDRIDFEPALRGFAMTVDVLFGSLRIDA
jgi:Uma2 family endonuclease